MVPRGRKAPSAQLRWFFRWWLSSLRSAWPSDTSPSPRASNSSPTSVWITSPNIHYHVALDGLSLWLTILATFLTPICVLISWTFIQIRGKEFFAFLLLLEFGLIGVFAAQDLFLFYVFWEVSLVPMYFLIGIWGHERRIYAAVKFFLYTMAASMLMLTAIIYHL